MVTRKRCTSSVCIALVSIVFFGINFICYLMVDSTSFKNFEEAPFIKEKAALAANIDVKKTKDSTLLQEKGTEIKKNGEIISSGKLVLANKRAIVKIETVLGGVIKKYQDRSENYKTILKSVLEDLKINHAVDLTLAEKWANSTQVVPSAAPELGSVLNKLCSSKIIKADNSKRGTQLKVLLTLESGQKALFKPQWYEREAIIPGPVYAGKDRHNAEVAAFHLSLLLDFRRVPLTVGRRIDLRREVMPVATPALRQTFFQEGNDTCFYGVCYYCSPTDPVCAKRDIMEGALILWLPRRLTFARYTHPWQRSYKSNMIARWEVDEDYCKKVKANKPYSLNESERLLDIVETAIFDFLIGNGDRHHYEAPINAQGAPIFLFDNGKSFGNPKEDHLDILAPLYQCCVLRKKTWARLLDFRGGALGYSLEEILRNSHIAPVLTKSHLEALDRRLTKVFAAVEICSQDFTPAAVLL